MKIVQSSLLLGGGRLIRLAGGDDDDSGEGQVRFAARISVMNLADPQMQMISGGLVAIRP